VRAAVGQFHRPDPDILAFAAQLGVEGVQFNTPLLPGERRWEVDDLVRLRRAVEAYGLRIEAIENVPRSFYDQVMLGGPDRDLQLEDYAATVRNVGDAGIPLLGHHFTPSWVWRTSFDTPGRGGATVTSFDLAKAERDRHVLVYRVDPEVGAHTSVRYDLDDPPLDEETMWRHYADFLAAALPAAEASGVRLALHPADPPLVGLGGAARLFHTVASFERAAEMAGSSAWGLNLCLGCCSEMPGGADNVHRMIDRFGPAGQICYVHFRDVRGSLPRFTECFIGEGNFDPAAVLRALSDTGFDGFLLDDHVPTMTGDTPWGHRSRGYVVGYLQGMIRMLEHERQRGGPGATTGATA
jgi:mannonate dehydratase